MKTVGMRDFIVEKNVEERLEEIYKNLSLCVSMASGYVWKEKVTSFSKLIAKELLDFFDEEMIKIEYPSLKNQFYRVKIQENSLCFHKNDLFQEKQKVDKATFLKEKLIYLEKCELPSFLTSNEKDEITKKITKEEAILLNQNYNRQELNGNRYFLTGKDSDKEHLLTILKKASFFSMTVEEYLIKLAQGNKKMNIEEGTKLFETTYNNYILELGAYIAKKIKEVKEKGI